MNSNKHSFLVETVEDKLLRCLLKDAEGELRTSDAPPASTEKPERHLASSAFPSPLFTTREAAEYLRICEKTLRTTCRDEGLEPIKIGNKFRYRKKDLDDYICEKWEASRSTRAKTLDIPSFRA